jgi:uncharacterized protein YceH (UPF0502 family)
VKNVPEDGSAKDMPDLRERVVRLEVQVAELSKRVESLSNYNHELYDYLTKPGK